MKIHFSQKIISAAALFFLLSALGCHHEEASTDENSSVKSEVAVVHPQQQTITEYLQFNGVTQFQKKNNIRSTNTGYITSMPFKTGDRIQQGAVFCTINTKEQQALKNISSKDTLKIKKDTIQLIKDHLINTNENIIYKIQFMSASQRVPLLSDKFKGLKDVGEYEDSGSFKYTAGEFKTIDEAMKYRSEMQKKGQKDCFVVKFKNGKRMKNDK